MNTALSKTLYLALVFAACLVATALPSREQAVLSSFTTTLEGQDDNVRRNIALASRKLQGIVIAPGSVFSFNDTVGEGSARGGYVDGRVLYREGAALEPGGGICQVSTTAFNAFLRAGFEIVTRHRHSQPVAYAPPGLDATIRYGKKDLIMKNPWPFPVTILAEAGGDTLTVSLRSPASLRFRYSVETEEEETELPLADDGREVRNGISVHVYRLKHADGKVLEKRLLYRDYYPPAYIK